MSNARTLAALVSDAAALTTLVSNADPLNEVLE